MGLRLIWAGQMYRTRVVLRGITPRFLVLSMFWGSSRARNRVPRGRPGVTVGSATFLLPVVLLGVLAGCQGQVAERATDRTLQEPVIVEEVLRYEVQHLADEPGETPGTAVCLAVRDATGTRDPSAETLTRLGRTVRAKPRSACESEKMVTVLAGPVEWLKDDETRVMGAVVRGTNGTTRLTYRVVRDDGWWVCAGPILFWDPL